MLPVVLPRSLILASTVPLVPELFANPDQDVADPMLDRLRQATIGLYDIAGELGRGGMAVVYVGKDLKLARTVAIKVMDPRLMLTSGMAERFLQEARIAARLQHPNIIVVHDIQRSEELIFFVMSMISGGALDELLRRPDPIPIDQLQWILANATRALAYAHSEGIIHRDVKPANIMVNMKGDIILTDFGIAKAVDGGSLTKSGSSIGTPLYMSPEQFSGQPVGPASDQYALGVTAYQLITGQPPFSGDLYQLIAAHGNRAPTPLRQLRPDCPAFLANAVMRMLAKEPPDRWPSLDDLVDVFTTNLPSDGGAVRRALATQAQAMQAERIASTEALSARTPMSPVPRNTGFATAGSTRAAPLLVSISPPSATVFAGGAVQLRARVASESGDTMPNAVVAWTSLASAVARVDTDGSVTGVAPGLTAIRATINDVFAETVITVESAPIARLSTTAPFLTMLVDDLITPDVTAFDVNGAPRQDVSLSWLSRSPGIVQPDGLGGLRALEVGHATVDVAVGAVRRTIDVVVRRRPVTKVTLRAVSARLELGGVAALGFDAFDDRGRPVVGVDARWSSAAPSVVYVDSAGTALAIGPGRARVTVEVDGAADSVELESVEAAIGAISISLAIDTAEIGESVAITLHVTDAVGDPRSNAGVRVWSSAPAVADVDLARMTAIARAPGTARILAAGESVGGTMVGEVAVELRVAAPVAVRIESVPASLDLDVDAVSSITLRGVDKHARPIALGSVHWSTDDAQIVAINAAGVVRGVAQGTARVRGVVQRADGTPLVHEIAVRVRRAPVAQVVIVGEHSRLVSGSSMMLTLSAVDTLGGAVSDPSARWTVSDHGVLTVDVAGRVTACGVGRAMISATVDGVTGTFEVRVMPAPLESFVIRASGNECVVGIPCALTLDARDATGALVLPQVAWRAVPADAATVSSDGTVTARRAGGFTVHAQLVDVDVDTSAANVHAADIELHARVPRILGVELPSELSLRVGASQQVRAQLRTEGDAPLDTEGMTWSSSDEQVARVSPDGRVAATGVGSTTITASIGAQRATVPITVREARVAIATPRVVGGGLALVAAAVLAIVFWPSPPQPVVPLPPSETVLPPGPEPTVVGGASGLADSRGTTATSKLTPIPLSGPAQTRPPTAKASATPGQGQPPVGQPTAGQPPVGQSVVPRTRLPDQSGIVTPGVARDTPRVAPPPEPLVRRADPPVPVEAPLVEGPTAADVQRATDDVVVDLRGGRRRNAELTVFFAEGAEHLVVLDGAPRITGASSGVAHAQFTLRVERRKGAAGILERRKLDVSMDVSGTGGTMVARGVTLGALRR